MRNKPNRIDGCEGCPLFDLAKKTGGTYPCPKEGDGKLSCCKEIEEK